MSRRKTVFLCLFLGFALVVYTQVTFFVIPPIGAIPEGVTVVMSRGSKTNFIDSPDGVCERIQGGVSLLCRGLVMGTVAQQSTIYFRLPYSSFLYGISTGGKTYDR